MVKNNPTKICTSIVNIDILMGLPAELKARRQQYEYYRNKLLTFKKI